MGGVWLLGVKTRIYHCNTDARFTSISRPQQGGFIATLCATSGLMHRSKDDRHDVSLDHLVGVANELDWDGTREQDVEVCSITTTTTGP